MAVKLTDPFVKGLETPTRGQTLVWDSAVTGFGVRVTPAGARAFILNYRTKAGRVRRITIGSATVWKVAAARDEAARLRRVVDAGGDPLADLQETRAAPTVAELADRFEREHLPKRRPATIKDYKAMLTRHVRPALGTKKVADIAFSDIDRLHRKLGNTPYVANRVVGMLSKMFTLSIQWKWRTDNPCKGIEKNNEEPRHRYLSPQEASSLWAALGNLDDQQAASIFKLLMLTGARRSEVQSMKWADVDLVAGVWVKPASTTKQARLHRVPLSAPALAILDALRREAGGNAAYVFPGRSGGYRVELKNSWARACIAAGIFTLETEKDRRGRERVIKKPSARIHDLRHSYASVLASSGLPLHTIGALLGHSQSQTTHRYAHLLDASLRQATELVGATVLPALPAPAPAQPEE